MSFEVINADAAELELEEAILIYGGRSRNTHTTYATVHAVTVSPDAPPVIEAGRPLDLASLRRFAKKAVASLKVGTGLLPANVLALGMDYVAWWSPATTRHHYFECRQTTDRVSVGTRNGQAPTCDLIFVATAKSLSVYAFKGDGKTRPDAATPIMFAPYMNVYESGGLCLGSMNVPKGSMIDVIPAWEASFFGSAFTHPNNHSGVNYKGGLHQLSKDLLDGKYKRFPQRALKAMGKTTLGQLIQQFDNGRK